MPKVSITAPATTANLGPGFDCLAAALNIENKLEAGWQSVAPFSGTRAELGSFLAENSTAEVRGEGTEHLNSAGMGLFYNALAAFLALNPNGLLTVWGLELKFQNAIPLARGLGSSAACIVSALALAKEILAEAGVPTGCLSLAETAVELDGSADNVLAALYGGARLNVMDDGRLWVSVPLEICPDLHFIVAIPDLLLQTRKTRQVLPDRVPLNEAVQNSARLAALALALEKGDFRHLRELIYSPLHIPYRSRLIPGYQSIEQLAYEAGALAVTISGAGPSVLSLATDDFHAIGAAMVRGFGEAGLAARYVVSEVNSKGVLVERSEA